ncbi:late expression factor-1 [Neodiprion lecontei nucleopolyhedrovirus]|uniref:Late expression factor-1 n=1 Tax=Neodiprion lecontei nucleopolyhedrovirus (strain Canada) TaxID=654906 RepID=Q6JPA3_NPVNC|nr:late expression factor-1 [Neodiprion lecontei nucleopolyhedrovirus]AAQ99098.1 late expression factor-1 [Neodiprion lecontei nucleopolyhedrovirus]
MNNKRYWYFKTKDVWTSKLTFNSFDKFLLYVTNMNVECINVRELIHENCREWIIDIDSDATDADTLNLQNNVAIKTLQKFFVNGNNKIYTSGNRGLHVWLDREIFSPWTSNDFRIAYAGLMDKSRIHKTQYNLQNSNSFYDCFLQALRHSDIILHLSKFVSNLPKNVDVSEHVIEKLFPKIDYGLFTSIHRGCRVPLSYNPKGNKYSVQII